MLRPTWLHRTWQSIAHASGIAEIEALKLQVQSLQSALEASVARRSAALVQHDELVAQRGTTQRDLTSLLQRRDTWEGADVARFTELTTREHKVVKSIEAALVERQAADQGANAAQRTFVETMHERYRAEHLFGEKTRLLSTYAWLALTGVNIALFSLGQLFVERREASRMAMLHTVASTAAAAAVEAERASITTTESQRSRVAASAPPEPLPQPLPTTPPATTEPRPSSPPLPTAMTDHDAAAIEEAGASLVMQLRAVCASGDDLAPDAPHRSQLHSDAGALWTLSLPLQLSDPPRAACAAGFIAGVVTSVVVHALARAVSSR